jgi:RNA polymerase sigma-70 factor (ECF subfamily)
VAADEPNPPTHEILSAVRNGDEQAAAKLVETLYPLVLRIVRSYRAPRTSEEDLCQMIFVRIFQNLHQYAGLAPFEHWVSRLSVNTCLKQIEKERVRPELRYADLSAEQAELVERLLSAAEEVPEEDVETARDIVDQLLSRLDPKDRLIMTLMYLDNRSVAEIRELTGWGTASIKVRAFRARHKLKRLFAQISRKFE